VQDLSNYMYDRYDNLLTNDILSGVI